VKADPRLNAEWFWIDRWDKSSAALLTMEQQGVYRAMLSQAWQRGARLPNDPEAVQRAIRCTGAEWERCWPVVARYWRVEGEWLVNDTQLEIYGISKSRRDAAHAKAMAAAAASPQVKAKRARQGQPQAGPQAIPHGEAGANPSSLLVSVSTETETATKTGSVQVHHEVDHKVEMIAYQREQYGRAVWDAWREKRGRGGPEMSSAEWDLIAKWMDQSVPLRVVLRGIADCRGQLTPSKPLTYAAPAVREAIQQWRKSITVGA
jgi:uncharacterized protein YdaU (DUF1376 family)